ncbi:MAG: DUF1573 domain-containing protein, partial [Cyclobacteriaceae bacterium]
MAKKWVLFLIFLVYTGYDAFARQYADEILFQESSFDFGKVTDSNQRVGHEFIFINNSKRSISIADVNPTCGCLVTEWTRNKVQPGDSGKVHVVFNPYNRPGPFAKHVDVVFSDGRTEQVSLRGTVLSTLTPEQEYPFTDGTLRSEKRRLFINNAESGSFQMLTMRFYNESADTLRIQEPIADPNNPFVYKFDKYIIAPSEPFALDGVFKAPEQPGYYEFGQQIILEGKETHYLSFDIAAGIVE